MRKHLEFAEGVVSCVLPRAGAGQLRQLLARQPVGNSIWIALAWCAGTLLVTYVLAMLAYRRKVA